MRPPESDSPAGIAGLRRSLTTFDLAMIAIGSTIGSGIFLTPSLVAGHLPSLPLFLTVWVLGGVVALCGALSFAELGGMMPRAGGMYAYLTETYGPLTGFLFGWAYFLVVNTGGIAALSIAFATYLGFFIPLEGWTLQATAIGGLAIVTALNITGVRTGGMFADLFTILKLAGIAALIVIGLGWGSRGTSIARAAGNGAVSVTGSALAAAMVGVLWSYGGWQHASFATAEARRPARSIPIAMVVGAAVVTLVYILANVAYLSLLPLDAIAASPRLAADAVSTVLGAPGGALISLAIFISTFGSVGIYTLTAPRIYFAMAQDGLFFKRVAAVHPRFRTPAGAILIQSAWAAILILFWQTFDRLISYVVFTDWIFFGLTGAAVLVLRKTRPAAERPYRTFGYPFTPLIFVGISIWFVVNTLIDEPAQAWAGLGFLAAGIPVYYFWKRGHESK
jgi:APA family basic amino acid/polyamine antiporter